jgi:signal peptidase I
VAAAAAAAFAIRMLRPFRVAVAGRSMEPSLRDGDWLLATRRGARARGAVVVVPDPRTGLGLVKRIAAGPGDEIDGRTLGPDEYLVTGDNAAASTDGRTFGTVRGSAIEGVVRFRYAPRAGPVRRRRSFEPTQR